MIFLSRSIVCASRFGFIVEVAEVVGLVIAPYRRRPFLTSFAPVDTFIFGGFVGESSLVAAVLGECAEAQVTLPVVPAVVVDVVDDKMVRGV